MKLLMRAVVFAALVISAVNAARAEDAISSGTGFAVTDDGWLLTNAHVVESCHRIEVAGKGIAGDPRIDSTNDLALIKVDAKQPMTPLVFRNAPIRLGEDIVAIGFPLAGLLSDSIKITTGNVNALAGLRNDTRYIQISTPIQPGNSGGPVVDRAGYLLGITTATFSKKAADEIGITAQNVNFAIRASVAELFLQSQGIAGQSGAPSSDTSTLATADIADKISPSAHQILCYGSRQESASSERVQPDTNRRAALSGGSLLEASGYDAIGFDYATLKDVSYRACKSACEGDAQCKAITYNAKHRFCFLKDNVVALIRNSDALAAYSSSKAADIIMSRFTSFSGVDVPGGDYKRIRQTSYLECFLSCIDDSVCRAFAYVPKKKECWLKDALGTPKPMRGVELGLK